MLSRRGFFGVAAGAAAVAAGGVAAMPAPAAVSTGVDLAAGADRTAVFLRDPTHTHLIDDWANDNVARTYYGVAQNSAQPGEMVRLQLRFEPNDLTREQLAANLPVPAQEIGAPLPKNTPAQERRHRQLLKKCNDGNVPRNETDAQYLKRMSLPCPGRLE